MFRSSHISAKKQRNKEMVEKPIFAAIMTAAMVSGSLISTNTEDYANQKNVELKMDEYWADSDSVESEKVSCEGENTGEKSVYYIIEYMDKDGKWRYSDTTLLVGSGLKCPILSTGRQNNKTNFRLQLNPYGTKKAGAKANGRIWPAENK